MSLASVFHFSLYVLVALAGAMLAFGEESFFPSGLTVLLSGFVLYFNERSARLRLAPWVGNLLGLAALGALAYEFFGESPESRLLAVAHFLVYITWIVLLQAKGVRQYWFLCALSLLQVAVGSVLTGSTGVYGLMLLTYLLLALWTLSVFTLFQGAFEFGGLDLAGRDDPAMAASAEIRSWAAARALVPASTGEQVMSFRDAFSADRHSAVQNAIQQDFPGRWIVPRFVMGVLGLSVAGLTLGLAMFLLVPRVWVGGGGARYQGEPGGGQAVVGFSGEVRLGQIGQILESTERVMRVEIFDLDAEKPLAIEELVSENGLSAPLFRGSVLERYLDGRWKASRDESLRPMQWPSDDEAGLIRQEYKLDMVGSEVLFAMRPIGSLARLAAPRGMMTINIETSVFAGSIEGRDPIYYYVYSKRRKAGDTKSGRNEFGEMFGSRNLSQYATRRYLLLPDAKIDRLKDFARDLVKRELAKSERLIDDDGLSPERRMAQTLEAHLRDSDEYAYSLNMAVEHPERDPVEEFLFVRKRGHCEYFASALALMLRAVQIPARLVSGFKGADFHASEGYYEVQQRHAHVWVEAHVDGQWIVLDPTPAARDEVVRNVAGHAGFWKNARSSIQSLWSTYVVSLSLNRQQQTLYEPLQGSVFRGWGSLSNLLSRAAAGVAWIKGALASPEQFLSPRGAALGLILCAGAWAIVKFVRRGTGRARRRALGLRRPNWISRVLAWLALRLTGRAPDPAGMIVEFYERFLTLMSASGFARREDQTQREFARQVEEALGDRLAASNLSQFPGELAELFYRVRFGEGRLEPLEAGDIEQRLIRLEGALAPQ